MTSNDHSSTEVVQAPNRAASDISPKVSGSVAAGAIATLTVFVAAQLGLDIPPGVEGAIAILVATVAGYFIRDNR
jgi:hypothetical protein